MSNKPSPIKHDYYIRDNVQDAIRLEDEISKLKSCKPKFFKRDY